MAIIKEIKGNIFNSKCQVIVNAVNCEGVMGKGIALEFKYRFPDMFEEYLGICQKGELNPGALHIWRMSSPWILNFPTKILWKFPSKIEYIEAGLKEFAKKYSEWNITSIAFPQLGASSGGLIWPDVHKLMLKHLKDLKNLEVEIYSFDRKIPDSYFLIFSDILNNLDEQEIRRIIGLTKKQVSILERSYNAGKLISMFDIQNLEGIGEISLQKIYSYINIQQEINNSTIQKRLL